MAIWTVSGNTPETAPSQHESFEDAVICALGFINNLYEEWSEVTECDEYPSEMQEVSMTIDELDALLAELDEADRSWELGAADGSSLTLKVTKNV